MGTIERPDDDDIDFMLPYRWKKKCPPNQKFTLADDATLQKILTTDYRTQPEFEGKDYITDRISQKQPLLICKEPSCMVQFTNHRALKSHEVSHRDRKIRCSFCETIFKTEDDRSSHINQFHPDLEKNPGANPLQCKKCGRIPRDIKALCRHIRDSHKGPPVPCPLCGVLFNRPDNLKEHLKYKHEDPKDHECEICGKVYAHKTSLRSHIKLDHRGSRKTLRCVLCDTVYGCKLSYNHHMNRHINPTFYPCKVCNLKFLNISHLKRHFESKTHKQVVRKLGKNVSTAFLEDVVPERPNEVKKKPATAIHVQRSFTKEELVELCKNKIAQITLHRVDEHIVRMSSDGQLFSSKNPKGSYHLNCTYCEKSLLNLEAVKTHEAICLMKLKSKKVHICPICNKEFGRNYELVKHSRSHSGERPYKCSYCDSRFPTRSGKIQHEKRVHFGIRTMIVERIYNCNYEGCTKQFSTGKSLQSHVRVHHLKIRYNCETCGKVFKWPGHYRKHVKMEHSKNPTFLLCKPCKRTYKTKGAMLLHLTTRRHKRKSREMRVKINAGELW